VILVQTMQATLTAMDDNWFAKIEQAQINNPRDARLQYLAGMACKARKLWGKAQQLLQLAAPRLTSSENQSLQHQAWIALAELAEQRGELDIAAQTWKKAALLG
jgi:HemY protein